MSNEKPVVVTNPAEIESIKRNGYGDIIGGYKEGQALDGYWYADAWSLREWRERQRLQSTNESLSGGNPSEKSEGLHSDHRGIPQARSSEGGNAGQNPGVSIQSREPVGSNSASVGRPSPELMNATDNDAAPSLLPFTADRGIREVDPLE